MHRSACTAVLLAVACSGPAPAPVRPPVNAAIPVAAAPADAPAPSQDEILAAIQKAMNELDEGTQGCWAAAAAVERFDIEGDVTARIDIGDAAAQVALVANTTTSPRLSACVVAVLGGYAWAPPLRGQTIQLPFRFRAPDGQSVIDRQLVPAVGQGAVSVRVLMDDATTGNDAVSMLEVAIAAGGTTGLRQADRAELWYFLTPAVVTGRSAGVRGVAAGDMMFVDRGHVRTVSATGGEVRAVVFVVPGGREGTGRAGALSAPLPAPTVASAGDRGEPQVLSARAAVTAGPATLFAEPATTSSPVLAASILRMPAGATVAEHVHAHETEMLYVLEGAGTMTVAGVPLAVTPTSVIQIPPNTRHAFTATAAVRAVQLYTPAGPEQRFKKGPP